MISVFLGGLGTGLGGCKQGDVGGSPHYPEKNTQHIQINCLNKFPILYQRAPNIFGIGVGKT